jgi:hypothetical protein
MENFPENKFADVVCDLCGGKSSKAHLEMQDNLYDVPGLFRIVRCSSCGFMFTNPRPKREYLDGLYEIYYGYMANLFKQFWAGWHIPFHLSHFTPETMKSLILGTSFQPILIRAVTPDFLFSESLEAYVRNKKKSLRGPISSKMTRSLVFRGIAALCFTFLDGLFSGKGECLQVEIIKPGDAYGI